MQKFDYIKERVIVGLVLVAVLVIMYLFKIV